MEKPLDQFYNKVHVNCFQAEDNTTMCVFAHIS